MCYTAAFLFSPMYCYTSFIFSPSWCIGVVWIWDLGKMVLASLLCHNSRVKSLVWDPMATGDRSRLAISFLAWWGPPPSQEESTKFPVGKLAKSVGSGYKLWIHVDSIDGNGEYEYGLIAGGYMSLGLCRLDSQLLGTIPFFGGAPQFRPCPLLALPAGTFESI